MAREKSVSKHVKWALRSGEGADTERVAKVIGAGVQCIGAGPRRDRVSSGWDVTVMGEAGAVWLRFVRGESAAAQARVQARAEQKAGRIPF